MKKELIFLLCSLIATVCVSQRKKALYLSSELEIGNYLGAGIDLNYLHKDKYSFSIGAQGQLSVPTNTPKDYDNSDDLPFANLKSVGTIRVLMGRVFNLSSKRLTRLNLQIGVSLNTIEKPTDWIRTEKTAEGYKYKYRNDKDKSMGFVISPSIEFPLFNLVGFKVAPKVHFTKGEIFAGVGFGVLLGDLK